VIGSCLWGRIDPTRAETECLNYDLHQSLDDTAVWFVYENWRSRPGLDAHMRASHLQAFLKAAPDLLAGDIDLRQFSMVSASAAPRA
jgi:quinol monooxygenase YgiN